MLHLIMKIMIFMEGTILMHKAVQPYTEKASYYRRQGTLGY